jgi:hypothetical protein
LELLALIFVVTSIVIPYYLQVTETPDISQLTLMERAELQRQQESGGTFRESGDFIWAIAIICLYLAHLAMAGATVNFLSSSFSHLFAPLMFAGITYYRLLKIDSHGGTRNPIVQGTAMEVLLLALGVVVITILVARIRMARHMLHFRNVAWDISSPTLFDGSFSKIAIQIQPLIYPPRVYHVSDEGILIEGWLYVMPIPFRLIQSIDRIAHRTLQSSGYYLATSTTHLVRIQLTESPAPVFISPRDHAGFLRYCQQHVTALRPETKSVETVVDVE